MVKSAKYLALLLAFWTALLPAFGSGYSTSAALPAGVTFNPTKRVNWAQPNSQGATSLTNSMGSTTHLGTTQTGVADSTGIWIGSTSGAVAGNAMGWWHGQWCKGDAPYDETFHIKTGSDITNVRIFVGMTSTTSFLSEDDPVTNARHVTGISYNTAVDGTAFFRTLTSSGAAKTRTATTIPIAASTAYKIRVVFVPGVRADFWINDTQVPGVTTTLYNTTNAPFATCGGSTTDTNAKTIYLKRWYIEAD